MAGTRVVFYADDTIGRLQRMVQDLREENDGDLMGCQVSAACAISDVLDAVGMPVEGIRLVLGPDEMEVLYPAKPGEAEPMACYVCNAPAHKLVQVGPDSFRLVCENHAQQAAARGHMVIMPNAR